MEYKVIIESPADQDARDYVRFIAVENSEPDAARRWLDGLESLISDLAVMPRRFPVIEEQAEFALELRQLRHHSHRVIYHVDDETQIVHILRIYHGRREMLTEVDIKF